MNKENSLSKLIPIISYMNILILTEITIIILMNESAVIYVLS